jgi:TolB-like protein/tetratricopeptide (TPR) repeat protein
MIPAGTRVGRYEIVSRLGAGGMGEVYRARDPRLGREVAIKVLPGALAGEPDRLRRFEQEARAASALDHPNVLAVHDVGTSDGRPFLVTELLEGQDLRALLPAGGLPPRRAAELALQAARGLAAAHDKGIVHRDLKPENLFVTADQRVKILDFGLAKLAPSVPAPDTIDETATRPGTILGTTGYMAPEQVRGEAADRRSDVFSLGAILYEMLSGRRAFACPSGAETLAAILKDDVPPIAGSGETVALERITRRCLEKDPAARFQSARDVAAALEAVVASGDRAPAARHAPAPPSVAVLPFKDLAGTGENAHLGLGLADATITELAGVRSLLVRPTAAILRYQDRAADPAQAGRELAVDAVVDGSFQRSGSRLRVTVQLIDVDGGRPLWATKVDGTLDDVFRTQDEVSRRIAEALEVELTPDEERRLGHCCVASAARESYLKGRLHLLRETPEDYRSAVEHFERARRLDAGFAPAWAALADVYSRIAYEFEPGGDWVARAEEAWARAMALDPTLAEVRYVRGRLLWTPAAGFDHAGALQEIMAAIALRPNLDEAHSRAAVILYHIGLNDESGRHLDQAMAISPANELTHGHRAGWRYHQGRFDDAVQIARAVVARAPQWWTEYLIAHGLLRLGRVEEVARTADRLSGQGLQSVLGLLAALRGDAAEAERHVDVTVRQRRSLGHYHHVQYDVAVIHALLGRPEQAVEWLRQAAGNGYPCATFFRLDPLLASLQSDERFIELIGELSAERERYRQVYEGARSPSGAHASAQETP